MILFMHSSKRGGKKKLEKMNGNNSMKIVVDNPYTCGGCFITVKSYIIIIIIIILK